MLRAADCVIDAQSLLAHGAFDVTAKSDAVRAWFQTELPAPDAHSHHAHDPNRHGEDVRAFALTFDRPLDWTTFGIWLTMLLHRHGDAVLRVKGILDVAGADAPVAIHGVQHLVHPPVHMSAWPDADRRSRIVFIVQGLEPAAIERSLGMFVGLDAAASSAAA